MAINDKRLSVTEFDFDDVKDNLKTFLSQQDEFTDDDLFDKDDYKNDYKYWNDTSLVWIDSVKEITPEHLEIIQRYI